MEFISDGRFKVGSTTLSTLFKVRIPEYGYELPEIHSSSPIPLPIYTSVCNIINWLDRGINVEFHDKKNAEQVFFFIMEYNRFAENENKKIDNTDEQYKLAINAQTRLYRMIDYKNFIETKIAEEEIPFKRNLFKGVKNKVKKELVSSSYKDPTINRNKPYNNIEKVENRLLPQSNPRESYAYDIFSPSPEISIIAPDSFGDIEFDS